MSRHLLAPALLAAAALLTACTASATGTVTPGAASPAPGAATSPAAAAQVVTGGQATFTFSDVSGGPDTSPFPTIAISGATSGGSPGGGITIAHKTDSLTRQVAFNIFEKPAEKSYRIILAADAFDAKDAYATALYNHTTLDGAGLKLGAWEGKAGTFKIEKIEGAKWVTSFEVEFAPSTYANPPVTGTFKVKGTATCDNVVTM